MKHCVPYTLMLLFILLSASVKSQNTNGVKPKIFNNFPEKINCSQAELDKAFLATANQNIRLSFSDNFLFEGIVTSNVVKYSNLQTVVIQSLVYDNAVFVISKITNTDNTLEYVGRIINQKYFDGYQLKKDAAGNYQFIKIETSRVIQDCAHK